MPKITDTPPDAQSRRQAQRLELDAKLSPFGRVAINADRIQGKKPRYHDGMTIGDVVILTGLPRDEAARRMLACRRDGNPGQYAEEWLSEDAGERYLAEPKPAEEINLQYWGEDYRAAPNAIFRSALFPALRGNDKENRRFLKEADIYCVAGLQIVFTGEQFDQSDLDVYLEILNLAQRRPLGTPVKFSAHWLLKALGLTTGGENHARLHSVLIRLCGGVVDATDHGKRYFGQLLHGGVRDEITLNYEIRINPDFAVLFGFGMFAKIDLNKRRALGRNNTAKALYGYYATHINPGAHHIETLARLAGLTNSNQRQTKATLIKAHEAMKNVGILSGYTATTDTIKADVNPTPGQVRALLRQTKKSRRRLLAPVADPLPQPPK